MASALGYKWSVIGRRRGASCFIYDVLIVHGLTSALLERRPTCIIQYNHMMCSRPLQGYHGIIMHDMSEYLLYHGIACARAPSREKILPKYKGVSSSNSSACFLFELIYTSKRRTWHLEVSSGYKNFWSKDPELYFYFHVCILHG